MPGMMDTILNLGLNDETVETLAAAPRTERFAWDAYRRFITMFSSVVLEIEKHTSTRCSTRKSEARRQDRSRTRRRRLESA
jgi:pyruvate,orthophosphate dikinase